MSSIETPITLKMLPPDERPREKLHKCGPQVLSNADLLAIIFGHGMKGKSAVALAQEVLCRFGSLARLADATLEELCQIKGLGLVKAIKLKAAFQLAARMNTQHCLRKKIVKPEDAYFYLRASLENQVQEVLQVLLLDVKNCIICDEIIAIGTLSQVLVHPREVFYPAIRHKAASIILAHNHPSGDTSPSQQDFEITRQLVSSGKLMGIPIQDHLIVTKNSYLSFKEKGFIVEN